MPLYNKTMVIRPLHCRSCGHCFYGGIHVVDEAIRSGLSVSDLAAEEAEKGPVWASLRVDDPIFVTGSGHGNVDIFTGDSETAIFTSTECDILSGRVVYLLSCLTAIELGPAIIDAGGIAYGGYKIPWTWMMTGVEDPYGDWYSEGFYRSSNEFPITLIHGESVETTRQRCIAEYNRWINIWETERADDIRAADAIKWLIWDRDGLVVLGDLSATIVSAEALTTLVVDVEPPTYVREVGETFSFAGELLAYKTRIPLPNMAVELWQVGGAAPIASTTTDGEGRWGFDIALDKGVYTIYAKFTGSDEYSPSSTFSYRVEVGVITPKIFGYPTRQYRYTTINPNQIRGSWFTCPEPGIAKSITIQLEKAAAGRVRCAIYKKSDNSLIGYTEEAIAPPSGLLTLNIVSGGKIDAIDYWLVAWSDNYLRTTCDAPVPDKAAVHIETYGAFPEVLSPGIYNFLYRIYCSYTPTPFLPERALTINSSPILGVPVKVDGKSIGVTPTTKKLIEGEHRVETAEEIET